MLKNFGMGKNLMQERVCLMPLQCVVSVFRLFIRQFNRLLQVLDEVSFLLNKVHGDLEKGVAEHDLPALIDITVGSIINAVLFGYRFSGSEVSLVSSKGRQPYSCHG